MEIYIDGNEKRFNPFAKHVIDGQVYDGNILLFPNVIHALGIRAIEADVPPAEFLMNPERYEVREDWETTQRPYTLYVRKDEGVIANDVQRDVNIKSRAYLRETDWYVSRFAETGVVIPDEIKAKRQAARDAVVEVTP